MYQLIEVSCGCERLLRVRLPSKSLAMLIISSIDGDLPIKHTFKGKVVGSWMKGCQSR